jgi:hypothetical protein
MILEHGKSYLWLFGVYVALFLGSAAVSGLIFGSPILALPVMALMGLFLLISQIRSGIALDGTWRAIYPKGTWKYRAQIIANIALVVFAIGVTVGLLSGQIPWRRIPSHHPLP